MNKLAIEINGKVIMVNPETQNHPPQQGRFKVLHKAINHAVIWA